MKNNWFDHTNNAPTPEHDDPDDNSDTGWGAAEGTSTRLTGTDYDGDSEKDAQYGLARPISVMPGDLVEMEVYVKYVDLTQADPNGAFTAFIPIPGHSCGSHPGTIVDGGVAGSQGGIPMPVPPYHTPTTTTGPRHRKPT